MSELGARVKAGMALERLTEISRLLREIMEEVADKAPHRSDWIQTHPGLLRPERIETCYGRVTVDFGDGFAPVLVAIEDVDVVQRALEEQSACGS